MADLSVHLLQSSGRSVLGMEEAGAPEGGVTGVAQGDSTYSLLFLSDGPQIVVTPLIAPDDHGTFRILGRGSVQVLITGLTPSQTRTLTPAPTATITNNAGGGLTVTAGGTLDLTVVTTGADTTITVS